MFLSSTIDRKRAASVALGFFEVNELCEESSVAMEESPRLSVALETGVPFLELDFLDDPRRNDRKLLDLEVLVVG